MWADDEVLPARGGVWLSQGPGLGLWLIKQGLVLMIWSVRPFALGVGLVIFVGCGGME